MNTKKKSEEHTYKNQPKYKQIVVRQKDYQKLLKVGMAFREDGILPKDEIIKDAILIRFAVGALIKEYAEFKRMDYLCDEVNELDEVSSKTLN